MQGAAQPQAINVARAAYNSSREWQWTTAQPQKSSAAQRSAAQRSTAQHSTAQHSTAQHSTSQHRAISAAQVALGITKPLNEPNHVPLLSCPFTFCRMHACASVAGGISRPRSGALVHNTILWGKGAWLGCISRGLPIFFSHGVIQSSCCIVLDSRIDTC